MQAVPRNPALQGLRGIAVLLILTGHFGVSLLSSCEPGSLLYPVSRFVSGVGMVFPTVLGTAPVIMFFVLSGYLTHPVFAAHSASWRYVARRWLRFWPTLAATTAATIIVLAFLPASNAGPWLNWGTLEIQQVTLRSVVEQLVLIGPIDTRSFNPPVWYLVHAARIWLLVPVAVLLVAGRSPRVLAAGIAVLFAGVLLLRVIPHPSLDLGLGYTAVYAIPFALGVIVAAFREKLDATVSSWPKWAGPFLAVLAVVLFSGVGTGSALALPGLSAFAGRYWFIQVVVIGAASAWVIPMLLRSSSAERLLVGTGAVALGAISYSVYMWQFVAMRTTASLLNGRAGGASTVVVAAFVAVAGVSLLGFFFVERPSIGLSARLRHGVIVSGRDPGSARSLDDPAQHACVRGERLEKEGACGEERSSREG